MSKENEWQILDFIDGVRKTRLLSCPSWQIQTALFLI